MAGGQLGLRRREWWVGLSAGVAYRRAKVFAAARPHLPVRSARHVRQDRADEAREGIQAGAVTGLRAYSSRWSGRGLLVWGERRPVSHRAPAKVRPARRCR